MIDWLNDRIIRDIRKLFEQQEEKEHYKPKRVVISEIMNLLNMEEWW